MLRGRENRFRSVSERMSGAVNGRVLDKIPDAKAAYSTRKLSSAYTGSALRVRRSTDNAEQDIGFTSAGLLDSAALSSFISGGSGFVVTWYDQSGSSKNATQTTAANQAAISSAGATFDATNDFIDLGGTALLATTDKFTLSWWENITTAAGAFPSRFKLSLSGGTRAFLVLRAPSGSFSPISFIGSQPTSNVYLRASTAPSVAAGVGVWTHWAIVATNTITSATLGDWKVYVNGVEQTIATGDTATSFGNTGNRFGQDDLGDSPADCAMNDIMIYGKALSAADIALLASGRGV